MAFIVGHDVYLRAKVSRENLHIEVLPECAAAFPDYLSEGTKGKIIEKDRKGTLTVRFTLSGEDHACAANHEICIRFEAAIVGSLLDVERRSGARKGPEARRLPEGAAPATVQKSKHSLIGTFVQIISGHGSLTEPLT